MTKRKWLDAATPGASDKVKVYIGDKDVSSRCTGAELALQPKTRVTGLVSLVIYDEHGLMIADPKTGNPVSNTEFYDDVWWEPTEHGDAGVVERLGIGKEIE